MRSSWKAKFFKTHRTPTAAVDMYLIRQTKDGSGDVSLGVPHGDRETVDFIVQALRRAEKQGERQ